MSFLKQMLAAGTVISTDVFMEPVTYEYSDKDGKTKQLKGEVGIIKRIPTANTSNRKSIMGLQESPIAERIASLVMFPDSTGGRTQMTREEVEGLDENLTRQLAEAVAKHHPTVFPHFADPKALEQAKADEEAKKN